MIDWLNTKAALSICTVMLIAAAGTFYDHHSHGLEEKEFEALLNRFVQIIDTACTSTLLFSFNITFSENADSSSNYFLKPVFRGEPYTIIITETFAVFEQEELRCSRYFASQVWLLSEKSLLSRDKTVNAYELKRTPMLSFESGSTINVEKIIINERGYIKACVLIYIEQ